jgi:hypothetical protein
MLETWIQTHPWMTFTLGIMSLVVINSFFISIGGGYKKFPPAQTPSESAQKELENLLKD